MARESGTGEKGREKSDSTRRSPWLISVILGSAGVGRKQPW